MMDVTKDENTLDEEATTDTGTVGSVGDDDDKIDFEPLELLARLKAEAGEPKPEVLPERLPLSEITPLTELFQPRGLSEKHVEDLIRIVKSGRTLEPITVMQVGSTAYLIDGHHRIEAYQRAKKVETIPVVYFEGSIEEAVLEAGRANSKAKLPMDTQERMDYAWRLVKMGSYTKRKIVEASGVSDRQVANMRKVMKALGADAYDHVRWFQASRAYQGKESSVMDDDERDEWMEAQANDYADRMTKEFSTKLATHPELAALAFSKYFGRKLPELVGCLRDHLPEDDEDDENRDF